MHWLSWPNALSLLRFPLAAAFVAFESTTVRTGIIVAAWLSDVFDGRFARRWGQPTRSGELLDPIADKVFVFAALVGFVWSGELPLWQFLLLLARDLFTVVAFLIALVLRLDVRFRARWSGKITTGLQILVVLVLLLLPRWSEPIVLVAGAASVYAALDYLVAGLRSLRGAEEGP